MKSIIVASALLPAERAALGKTGLATGGLAEDLGAAGADNDGLGVREDGGDGEAAGALDVHEERTRSRDQELYEGLRSVPEHDGSDRYGMAVEIPYLELVLLVLRGGGGVEKVYGENLNDKRVLGQSWTDWRRKVVRRSHSRLTLARRPLSMLEPRIRPS